MIVIFNVKDIDDILEVEKNKMPFVNEIIPEEEKDKFSFSVEVAGSGGRPTLWKWTIDRERGAFLVLTHNIGGGYEGTPLENRFVLSWNGSLVMIHAIPGHSQKIDNRLVMSWDIAEVSIPDSLVEHEEEVLQLIKEAFTAKGSRYNGDKFDAVNVNIGKVLLGCARS